MFTKEIKDKINLPEDVRKRYSMNNIVYFDIETTGFDREKDNIILISLGKFDLEGYFVVKQYFAEDLSDEGEILNAFAKDIAKFNKWCSYNGIAFDEPFIKSRMNKNKIEFNVPEEHIDLYRLIKPYHKNLGMERCNLKTVEKYIGVNRVDKIDGGKSVELYYEYLETKDEEIKLIIMLHNYEDVLNLPKIFKLLYEVEGNVQIRRDDSITEKQLNYLKSLISKNKIVLNTPLEKISKKSASKLISYLLTGADDINEINSILK